MSFNPKWIVGKTIERVEMNPFKAGSDENPRMLAHAPRIHFSDGSWIYFHTEETEVGEYGTDIGYAKPKRK